MTTKRIIPLFLIRESRLVKGSTFLEHRDVGDPLSQAIIYDAQGADEIILLDIEASRSNRTISTQVVRSLSHNCRIPIAVGGGIKSVKDAKRCFKAGADKIVVNTQAVLNPPLLRELSDEFGSQSVVLSVDVRKTSHGEYDIYGFSGVTRIDRALESLLTESVQSGVGEILLTAIDREGTLSGFDLDLYQRIRQQVSVPLIASGGAGSYEDIIELFDKTDCEACALGTMLFLRDYDIVRIKSFVKNGRVLVREA